MKNIVFATNNKNKLQEIRAIAGGEYNILSLSEIGCHDDIPETAGWIEGNAMLKARWVKDKYGYSKTITVNIGEVAAPRTAQPLIPWISARWEWDILRSRKFPYALSTRVRGKSTATLIPLLSKGKTQVLSR